MSLAQFGIGPLKILVLRFDAPTPGRAALFCQARIGIRCIWVILGSLWIAMLPNQLGGLVPCRLEQLFLLRKIQVLHGDAYGSGFVLLHLALFAFAVLHARDA